MNISGNEVTYNFSMEFTKDVVSKILKTVASKAVTISTSKVNSSRANTFGICFIPKSTYDKLGGSAGILSIKDNPDVLNILNKVPAIKIFTISDKRPMFNSLLRS